MVDEHSYIYRICDHIIDLHELNNISLNALKLLKLLYFTQITSLRKYDKVMFNENIVSHEFGPYVNCVFNKYKYQLLGDLTKLFNKINLKEFIYKWYLMDNIININDKNIIEDICEYFKYYNVSHMTKISMKYHYFPFTVGGVVSVDLMRKNIKLNRIWNFDDNS